MAISREDVIRSLLPEEPDYRRAAALGPEATPHLIDLVQEADPMLAPKAVSLASHLGGPEVSRVFELAASSDDAAVRVAAAAGAGRLGPGPANAILKRLLQDPDDGVLKFALRSTPTEASGEVGEAVRRIRDDTTKSEPLRRLARRVAASLVEFADWTSVTANVASGSLLGAPVTLSGTEVSDPPSSILDGSARVFDRPEFTPPLGTSDAIHVVARAGSSYTLQFGAPVLDPVLHLASLASTLHFSAETTITRLSGDAQFSVSGHDIVGQLDLPTDDGNGTVKLSGTFEAIAFTTTFFASDGIFLQGWGAAARLTRTGVM